MDLLIRLFYCLRTVTDLEENTLGGDSCSSSSGEDPPRLGILRRSISSQLIHPGSNTYSNNIDYNSSKNKPFILSLNDPKNSTASSIITNNLSYIEMMPSSSSTDSLPDQTYTSLIRASNNSSNSINKNVHNRMTSEDALSLLGDLAHFSTFAIAIYTHLLALYMYPCSGFFHICHATFNLHLTKCFKFIKSISPINNNSSNNDNNNININQSTSRTERNNIIGDNYFGLNYLGMSVVTDQLKDVELAFVSFKNDLHSKPYAVFIDREKAAVVVAIRGTLSTEDCITDLICASEEVLSTYFLLIAIFCT